MIHLHYQLQTDTAESAIAAAIQTHRKRGQNPQAVKVNPASGIEPGTVAGLPVETDEKVLPVKHFWVVT